MLNDCLTEQEAPAGEANSLGQALLFSPEIEHLKAEEERGVYTLERVKIMRPRLIDAIIAGTAQGEGQLSLASKLNCHHRTVSLVQRHPDYAEAIDTARQKTVARLRSAASKLVELIDNDPQSVPPNVRALAASQMLDKAELLDGRATQRTERTERYEIHGDWEQFIADTLPSEKQLAGDAVREIGPVIGSQAGEILSLGPPSPVLPAAGVGPGGDAESLDRDTSSEETIESDTAPDTDRSGTAARNGAGKQGGAGVERVNGGALDQMRPTSQKFSGNRSLPSTGTV